MQGDREDRIRHRAYEIWEREGRPEGRGQDHWAQACAEIEAEDRTSATADPAATVAAAKDAAAGVVKKVVRRTKKAATELLGVGLNAVVDVVEEAIAPKAPRARKTKAEPAATEAAETEAAATAAPVAEPAPASPKAAKSARGKTVKAEAVTSAAPKAAASKPRRKPAVSDTEPAH